MSEPEEQPPGDDDGQKPGKKRRGIWDRMAPEHRTYVLSMFIAGISFVIALSLIMLVLKLAT